MQTAAIILDKPGALDLRPATTRPVGRADVVVEVAWSGVSTGTERLLWSGRMPSFPGMGYPLVPGYEAVGKIIDAGPDATLDVGTSVFVPGADTFVEVRNLFGGAARRLVAAQSRVVPVADALAERATLLALAATAHHIVPPGSPRPELIVGHGVLGRLLARLCVLAGGTPPVVWERNPLRRSGACGYPVVDPFDDDRRDYACICDVSGSVDVIDTLVSRLAPGGEILLAGFYDRPVSFAFAPAFMREARLRVVAQWQPSDMTAAAALVAAGKLSLDGLVTHRGDAADPARSYRLAFEDADCLKMCLDWRSIS
jgi:3-hydroxyethyl bacteriochlorophyllide a dehydrogenase